jgi:hypothetical protein
MKSDEYEIPPLEEDRTAMMLGLVPDKRTPTERLLDAINTNGNSLKFRYEKADPSVIHAADNTTGKASNRHSATQKVAYRLANLLYRKPPAQVESTDIGPECFAGRFADGTTTVISWRGENFVRQRPSLRVRLHNRLIRIGNRHGK